MQTVCIRSRVKGGGGGAYSSAGPCVRKLHKSLTVLASLICKYQAVRLAICGYQILTHMRTLGFSSM